MKTVNKPSDNLGGLLKIWAIPSNDFSIAGKNISFSSTDNVYEIYCPPDMMSFSELKSESGAGILYNTTVTGFIVGDNESNLTAIDYLERRKWVVLFRDGNGKYKLAGTATETLRFNPDLNTGKDTIGLSGYEFNFLGKTLSRAVFVNNPF